MRYAGSRGTFSPATGARPASACLHVTPETAFYYVLHLGFLGAAGLWLQLGIGSDLNPERGYVRLRYALYAAGLWVCTLEYEGGGNPGHRPADASRTNRFIRSSGSSVPSGGECLLSCASCLVDPA